MEIDKNLDTIELLNTLIKKIDNLEKTYISINKDLINQNIKMSELLNGKLKEPEFDAEHNLEKKDKELFYYENNGKIIVYGSGTYENRPILKQYGEWNSFNKTWDLIIDKNELLIKFPNIIYKNI